RSGQAGGEGAGDVRAGRAAGVGAADEFGGLVGGAGRGDDGDRVAGGGDRPAVGSGGEGAEGQGVEVVGEGRVRGRGVLEGADVGDDRDGGPVVVDAAVVRDAHACVGCRGAGGDLP